MTARSALTCLLLAGMLAAAPPAGPVESVTLPSGSPIITFRILFKTGAAFDPAGKQGLAALTAAMLAEGGSREMSYDQIVRALFPMAASIRARTDKEMTVFHGATHLDNLDKYYRLLRSMLLDPGWRQEDFNRLRTDAINHLRVELRSNNDEELGKEALYNRIYSGHPYGHQNTGTVAALEKITLDDVKSFYRRNYTRANLVIGLAGACPKGFLEKVTSDFSILPEGSPAALSLPEPQPATGLRVAIIEKNTRATAISLGFPIPINRSSPDWLALYVAQSYFGQHRSSKGLLFNRLRELRGLNYGDYAYIEYFPRGMFLFEPEPNLARRQQIFQIWIRPVEPANGLFALRAALYELDRLVREGIPKTEFESTRQFLSKFVNLLMQTDSARLGYALDSKYYGIPAFDAYVKNALARLTLDDVNHAIRKYLRPTNLDIVIVTKDAQGMKNLILSGAPSSIQYVSPKPKEILEEDKAIGRYQLNVSSVDILPAGRIFED
jgi:zinc protease